MTAASAQYRELVEADVLPIFRVSAACRLIECNDAFARLLGCTSPDEAVGLDTIPRAIDPASRDAFLARVRAEGRAEHVLCQLRTPGGDARQLIVTGIGEFDADGTLVGVHGYAVEVAARAQAEKLETIGRLAGGVAHDFNNLLTAILGYTELLLASPHISAGDRADVAEIQKAGQRAALLTQQLLAFSRRQMLIPKDVDLNAMVATLQNMLLRLIREDITLSCDLAPEPAIVHIDPAQLEHVLLNLVLNARDAMPSGGRICVSLARVAAAEVPRALDAGPVTAEAFVQLRVSDTGVGIAPELRAHLFEPFFTTKEIGKGSGLGLASVYGIVRQSNGAITVDSEPGAGTTFTMYFPAVAPQGAADETSAREATARGETILLVEDEPAVRTLVAAALRRQGYRVLEAETPSVACTLFDERHRDIALLLTDVVMPEMNGPALAQRLVGVRPDLRVLFMSGYADAVRPLDIDHPLVGFLGKPFQASALVARVRELLDSGAQRDAGASGTVM